MTRVSRWVVAAMLGGLVFSATSALAKDDDVIVTSEDKDKDKEKIKGFPGDESGDRRSVAVLLVGAAPEPRVGDPGRTSRLLAAGAVFHARIIPIAMLALLAGEGLLLGVRYDSASLEHLPGRWWRPLRQAVPAAMPLTLAVGTAGLLIVGTATQPPTRQPASRGKLPPCPPTTMVVPRRPPGGIRRPFHPVRVDLHPLAGRPARPDHLDGGMDPRRRTHPGILAGRGPPARRRRPRPRPPHRVRRHRPPQHRLRRPRLGRRALHPIVVGPLRKYTFATAATILRWVDPSAWTDAAQYLIGSRDFVVEITAPCSGYEGIGLTWVCLGRGSGSRGTIRFPRRCGCSPSPPSPSGSPTPCALRALVFIGGHVSADVAAGASHSYAGGLLFSGVILTSSAWIAHRSAAFSKVPGRRRRTDPRRQSRRPLPPPADGRHLRQPVARTPVHGCRHRPLGPCRWPSPPSSSGITATSTAAPWPSRPARWRSAQVCSSPGSPSASSSSPRTSPPEAPPLTRPPGGRPRPALDRLPRPQHDRRRPRRRRTRLPRIPRATTHGHRIRHRPLPTSLLDRHRPLVGLFAVLHVHLVAAAIAAAAYAWAARRHGRLADAVAAHAVTNVLLTAYVLAFGRWHVWTLRITPRIDSPPGSP